MRVNQYILQLSKPPQHARYCKEEAPIPTFHSIAMQIRFLLLSLSFLLGSQILDHCKLKRAIEFAGPSPTFNVSNDIGVLNSVKRKRREKILGT
jgi:hypothetical protein